MPYGQAQVLFNLATHYQSIPMVLYLLPEDKRFICLNAILPFLSWKGCENVLHHLEVGNYLTDDEKKSLSKNLKFRLSTYAHNPLCFFYQANQNELDIIENNLLLDSV